MRSAAAVRSKKGEPWRNSKSFSRMDLIGVLGATSARNTQYGCVSDLKRYSESVTSAFPSLPVYTLTQLFKVIPDAVIGQLLFCIMEQVLEQLLM